MPDKTKVGLPDQPIKHRHEDALGMGDYAAALTKFVQGCDTPMTIALQGDWGSGKTSLMNVIAEGLDKRKFQTVWFNTWEYSQFNMENTLAISMMSKFADVMAQGDKKSPLIRSLASGLWTMAKTVAVGGASLVAQGDTMKEVIATLETGAGGDDTNPTVALERIREDLRKVVEERTENGKKRIVVFIDDLDRLVPRRAVDLLEVLKLFLDIRHCVYMIACDYSVVTTGLQEKFGFDEQQLAGRNFFDKVIQVPVQMPKRRYNVNLYIEQLLTHMGIDFVQEGPAIYYRLAEHSIGFNPRTMKRLLNSAQLLTFMIEEKKDVKLQTSTRVIFAILCMIQQYEAIYDHLIEDLTAECLLALRNGLLRSPEFRGLREQIQGEEHRSMTRRWADDSEELDPIVARAAEFMRAFVDSIQLDKDKEVSNEEMKHLKDLMSLSSLVTVGREKRLPTVGMAFAIEMENELRKNKQSSSSAYGSVDVIRDDCILYSVLIEDAVDLCVEEADGRYNFGISRHRHRRIMDREFIGFGTLLCEKLGVEMRARGEDVQDILYVGVSEPDALESFKRQLFELLDKVSRSREAIQGLWNKA